MTSTSLECPPQQQVLSTPKAIATRDVELLNEVIRALRDSGRFDLNDLQVDIRNGVALLCGQVASYYLKQTAQTIVMPVRGVRGVSNEIVVVPPAAAASRGSAARS